jgi:hypothetical protein
MDNVEFRETTELLTQLVESVKNFESSVHKLSEATRINGEILELLLAVVEDLNERVDALEDKTNSLDTRTTGSIFVGNKE